MNFDNPLFVLPSTCGAIFIIAGFVQLKFPPKKINGLYGYRTKNSKKSQAVWDFSQKYSSREMIKSGGIFILISFLGLFLNLDEEIALALGIGFLFLFTYLLWIRTEKAIKKKFEKEE